jgi:hypothetical protein
MEVIMRILILVLTYIVSCYSYSASSGIETKKNGTFVAKWTSDSSDERCSQMTGKLHNAAKNFCTARSSNSMPISPVQCDEAKCIVGICTHYGYYNFACVKDNPNITFDCALGKFANGDCLPAKNSKHLPFVYRQRLYERCLKRNGDEYTTKCGDHL